MSSSAGAGSLLYHVGSETIDVKLVKADRDPGVESVGIVHDEHDVAERGSRAGGLDTEEPAKELVRRRRPRRVARAACRVERRATPANHPGLRFSVATSGELTVASNTVHSNGLLSRFLCRQVETTAGAQRALRGLG